MFEIVSDIAVERLKIIFPNQESRMDFIMSESKYKKVNSIRKLIFEIQYLDKFKNLFPDYEYEVNFEKVGFLKSKAVSFSVWCAIVEREVNESQYIFSKLNEVIG